MPKMRGLRKLEACSICMYRKEDLMRCHQETIAAQGPDPDPLRFLNTNEPPSDIESSYLQLALADKLEKIGGLDAHIQEVRQQLRELLLQRWLIRHQADKYKTVLHPIRRIPAEVFRNIFLFCADDIRGVTPNSLDPTSTTWTIPRVSRAWRAIALSFPRLWANIHIPSTVLTIKDIKRHQIANSPYLLTVQLGRSANYPLSVTIRCPSRVRNLALLQVLAATSGRWRIFHADLTFSSYEVLSTYITSFPLLTEVYLNVIPDKVRANDDSGGSDDYDENGAVLVDIIKGSAFSKVFKSCPNLKTIQVHPRYLPVMEVPFSNIETFIDLAVFSSIADCIAALRLLPRLRVFDTMHQDGEELEVGEPFEPFELPHLQRLVAYGDHRGSGGSLRLLEFLITPSLKNLTLRLLDENKSLLAFLHLQSECKIQSLELDGGNLSDMDCVQILERTPALETLTLRCPWVFTDKFVERLMAEDGLAFVPLLKTLKCETCKGSIHEPFPEVDCLQEVRPGLHVLISRCGI